MRALTAFPVVFFAGARSAFAHGIPGHDLYLPWTFDPWILIPLFCSGAIFLMGMAKLWWRAGYGRARLLHGLAYGAGWASLFAALISPLHWLGERVFTFHMIEHEIVMAVAAPLMVLARPIGTMLWGLPGIVKRYSVSLVRQPQVRALWKTISEVRNATLLHAVAIWGWHAPGLFDTAVANVVAHRLQHLSFFVTAILFWWSVMRRGDYGVGAFHVFVTMLHTSALGALMALAPRVLYGAQTLHSLEWGLTPIEDQQLAGVVMWIPAGTVYAGAALALTALWISRSSKYSDQFNALPAPHLDQH